MLGCLWRRRKHLPKLKPEAKRIVGYYAEHNVFSDKWVIEPGREKMLRDLHGRNVSTVLPSYAELKAEVADELKRYGYEVYLCSKEERANALLRIYRGEYKNAETGITGGCFGGQLYMRDRTGKYWVTKDDVHNITTAEFAPTIDVQYYVSCGEKFIYITAEYEDCYIRVEKMAK